MFPKSKPTVCLLKRESKFYSWSLSEEHIKKRKIFHRLKKTFLNPSREGSCLWFSSGAVWSTAADQFQEDASLRRVPDCKRTPDCKMKLPHSRFQPCGPPPPQMSHALARIQWDPWMSQPWLHHSLQITSWRPQDLATRWSSQYIALPWRKRDKAMVELVFLSLRERKLKT